MKSRAGAYPYLAWMLIFIIIPVALIIYYSLTQNVNGETVFTLDNFARAFGPVYLKVMWRSVSLAFICTVISLGFGYPAALIMAEKNFDKNGTVLFLIIMPMWMNFLLRTYAWLTILEKNGLINTALGFLRLPKLDMLYTSSAVILGMVYNFLPFMILPIYSVIVKIDRSLIEAAQDLGANPSLVFRKLIIPLSLPGVLSGVTMVFVPAVSTFVISQLLGGGKDMLLGDLVEIQFLGSAYNPHLGSAIALVMMIIVMLFMYVMNRFGEGEEMAVGL